MQFLNGDKFIIYYKDMSRRVRSSSPSRTRSTGRTYSPSYNMGYHGGYHGGYPYGLGMATLGTAALLGTTAALAGAAAQPQTVYVEQPPQVVYVQQQPQQPQVVYVPVATNYTPSPSPYL